MMERKHKGRTLIKEQAQEPFMGCHQCGKGFDTSRILKICKDHFGLIPEGKKQKMWMELKRAIDDVPTSRPTVASVERVKNILKEIKGEYE